MNMLGLALPLAFSLVIARIHKRPFFLWWTGSYAAYMVALALIGLHDPASRPGWLAVPIVLGYHAGAVALQQVARLWGAPEARPPLGWLQALLLLAGLMTLLATTSAELALTPSVLLTVAVHLQLAWVIDRRRRSGLHRLQAAALAAMGLWILGFPLFAATPWAWLGLLVSGGLHLLVGIGMVVCLLEDVARELAARNRDLVASDAAKTAFVTTVTHEVRTPTTVLKTGLWLLHHQRDRMPEALQAQVIADLLTSADRLERLTRNVLDVARQDAGLTALALREGDLEEVLVGVRPMLALMAEQRGIRLHLEADGSTPVMLDPEAMTHVVSNLVDNALRHTPTGGTVEVEVGHAAASAWLEVRDTGCGVPPDEQARIFERFAQGPHAQASGGAGLGLWLCRQVVEAHGGTLSVESDPASRLGATFRVEVPLASDQEPAPTPREAVAQPATLG